MRPLSEEAHARQARRLSSPPDPEPLAHPATSDRNVYDRTWFNGYTATARLFRRRHGDLSPPRRPRLRVQRGAARWPAALCFYGSRRAPIERTEMQVGPFRLEVIEPMRRTRLILEDNASGLSCDLTFSARTAAIKEARQTLYSGPRATMNSTRFDQFGRWSGVIRTPDGEIKVGDDLCMGTKDRSWGVRRVGEPEGGGAPNAPGGFFFLWASLIFGRPHLARHLLRRPARRGAGARGHRRLQYASEAAIPAGVEDGLDQRMATPGIGWPMCQARAWPPRPRSTSCRWKGRSAPSRSTRS